MAQVTLVMDSDEQRLWNSLQRVIGQQEKMEGSARSVGRAYRQLEREGRRVFEAVQTPAERYAAEIRRLQVLLRKGAIDQQTFNRATGQAAAKLKAAGAATKGAFGSGALSDLKAYATSMLGVGAAIGVVTAAMREQRRVRDEAGKQILTEEDVRRKLIQVSDTPEELADNNALVNNLATEAGISYVDAGRTVFAAASASDAHRRNIGYFGNLRDIGMDSQIAIEADQKLRANFGDSVGSYEAVTNKLLAAAGSSPVSVDEIAAAAATAAPMFREIGATDAELLGFGGVIAEATSSPEQGFEQVKSLASQIDRKLNDGRIDLTGSDAGLRGMSLIDALPRLAEEGKLLSSAGEVQGLKASLGEDNARLGMSTYIQNRDKVRQRIIEVREAGSVAGTEMSSVRTKLKMADGSLMFAKAARQEEQDFIGAKRDRFGDFENIADAVYSDKYANLTRQGRNEVAMWINQTLDSTRITGNENYIRSAFDENIGRLERGVGTDVSGGRYLSTDIMAMIAAELGGERKARFDAAIDKLAAASEKIDAAASKINDGRQPTPPASR
ncbi:MAG: hypothetical protein AAF663_00370 [Planctomycetota bacterium]